MSDVSGTPETQVHTTTPAPGVLQIVLDGPVRRNALGNGAIRGLDDAVHEAADDEVRAVVLTGTGGHFCAGADLKAPRMPGRGVAGPAKRLGLLQGTVDRLHRLPKPVLAAVEGAAVGIGWSYALACDMTVAGEGAFFASPFVERGLVPDGGCAWFLAQAVGTRRAAELTMLGERLPAARAEALGLVNRVVPDGSALQEALELAVRLAAGAPDALMLTKRMLTAAGNSPSLRDYLDQEWLAAALDLTGPDPVEGVAAFRERRAPDFSGHR
ncbi:enoyl-CoA hydratase/isomerase family protein [Streptomyces olivaceiscleroticus]|uniref:Enoyl-CoA hydratase n=1 Tax=Streptomyces olivaceiscleroticus TaxID=68245 RepID=A0ABN1ALP2_9ACTN